MAQFLTDIRHAARSFWRTPGLTLALLLTIAIGIGSNVSIQGFIRGFTRAGYPLKTTERLVSIFGRDAHREAGPLSYEGFASLRSVDGVFEWLGAASVSQSAITIADQSATTAAVAAVTPDLAGLLHLPLQEGVVISHQVWQNEFHAMSDVRGQQIRIDGLSMRVGGVAPDWLEGVYRDYPIDIWTPLQDEGLSSSDRATRNFWVVGRLRRGVSSDQAQTAVRAVWRGTGDVRVVPYKDSTPEMSAGISRVVTLLSIAAGAVLFIACANVASFLLGRASARSHETSLRLTLGASRAQLARALLADSVVISVAGGASSILLAQWTSRIIPALLFDQDAERLVYAPDPWSMAAASAVCAGIVMVCGLLPVAVIPYDRPWAVLRQESARSSKTVRRLRAGLVIAQMASCCLLVISTALLLQGLSAALQTDAGRRLGQPILAAMKASGDAGIRYFRGVEHRMQSMPGIFVMAWTDRAPGGQPTWRSFRVEPPRLPLRDVTMERAWFTAGSIQLFDLPPRAGRMFGLEDPACRTAIVNETAAEMLFDGSTAGRSIEDSSGRPVEVIGVVAMRGGAQSARRPTIYYYADETGPAAERIAPEHFRVPIDSELARVELEVNVVSPNYFEAMGFSLVAGRMFSGGRATGACRTAVVNRQAADLYFGGNAVGAAVIDDSGRRTEIIGAVHAAPLGTFQRRVDPAIYFPMAQDYLLRMTLILGAREANDAVLAEVRRRIESVPERDPTPIIVKTLESHLRQTALAPLRIATVIIGASAGAGLLLSMFGLFGALSDAARQRRRELAIRIALGAQRRHVIGQVLKEGGQLACAGVVAGMLGSLLLSRLLTGVTLNHDSPKLWVWLAAPMVLAGAVGIASVLPARRALIVSPLSIMRD